MLSLKTTLLTNSISSGITGIILCLFAKPLSPVFGLNRTSELLFIGLFLIAFSAFVLITALQRKTAVNKVRIITALDLTWVLSSILLLFVAYSKISVLGIAIIIAVLLWVAIMAYLQLSNINLNKSFTD